MLIRLVTVCCLTLMLGACGTTTLFSAPKARQAAPPAKAPRVEAPPEATRACPLYVLPANPTNDDLKVGYATRGAQVIACDGRRQLALAALDRQHNALDRHEAERARRRCPWWRLGFCKPPD